MDDDDELFREAMVDVARLKVAAKPTKPRGEPTLTQLARRESAASERRESVDPNYLTLGEVKLLKPHDLVSWKKDGVQEGVFKKLRLGKYPVDGRLDLHRKTVKESRVALFEFVQMALAKGWRCVLVNHGRGEKSPTPARIKSYAIAWLAQIPEVLAYHHPEKRQLGGGGVVLVLLRKSAAQREENRERHGQKTSE
ncbi:MAG TPA: DNA endonuclease SmrA [Pseudomonadales bacterium]|nr:DNA endonuclease SmrA [Pseudomonadales bacterium]